MAADERFIRMPEVEKKTGLSRATIYRHVAAGDFPTQVKIGRISAWSEQEILAWIEAAKQHRQAA
jgi:prophage regulatory protein